ncbi:transcriptional regulator [Pleomorphomonas diazotrophica]|uniref:Transcriptional regulator n=1 Tax=Pleomorphomonas diazotrophica TaxID=1166257 RepID=A0A1I4V9V7_9HYPH|nr:GAF domain-containing protein [Pleomorphomonas diazotrophica]PKR87327.1 transcriptional regulator [Pleomorphomonas diazotrophica]SFM97941.1 GAF domain-containing protein [Pleomorphomonas diazotrophica]
MRDVPLEAIRDSFEGIMPSVIATTDAAGMPNLSYLSHVHYVDSDHVALSNQFFSKTAANVELRGRATVAVLDGRIGVQHTLDLVFESSSRSGPIFDRVSAQLDVMASLQGKSHMLKLRAVDIYRVEACRRVDPVIAIDKPQRAGVERDLLAEAAAATAELTAITDAETLLDRSLEILEERCGFRHSMILIADEEGRKLQTVASRGYPHFGFGAEIAFGDGIVGVAAERRLTLRIPDMRRSQRYVSAVAIASGLARDDIPLPAIAEPQCQIAVPLISGGRLSGVIFAESEESFAFSYAHEAALEIIARQIAASLLIFELTDAAGDGAARHTAAGGGTDADRTFGFRFFPRDGGVFIDNDYVIRGVPGRLLYHFVRSYAETGRREFSNREIRRDRAFNLPDFKDNLETRLILLRRRLEERGGPIRLERPDRGQIRLLIEGVPEIRVVEG